MIGNNNNNNHNKQRNRKITIFILFRRKKKFKMEFIEANSEEISNIIVSMVRALKSFNNSRSKVE